MEKFAILSAGVGNSIKDGYIYDKVYLIQRNDSTEETIKKIAARSTNIVLLDVFAHGKTVRTSAYSIKETGGYGAYLGKDNIKHANADIWAPLSGKMNSGGVINMHVCKLADVSRPSKPEDSAPGNFAPDGLAMCRKIAGTAKARVRASPDFQEFTYTTKGLTWYQEIADSLNLESYPANYWNVDFGSWEGITYIFDPNGRDVRQE